MNRIDDSVLLIIRSFQTYEELHFLRRVCKRWTYIESISKHLDSEILPYIPPTACFKNIEVLYVPLDNKYFLTLLLRVLEESKSCLKLLDIHMGCNFPTDDISLSMFPLPTLHALRDLELSGFSTEQFKIISRKAPNVSKLQLATYPESSVDISCFPDLKTLMFPSSVTQIKGRDKVHLEEIQVWTKLDDTLEHALHWLSENGCSVIIMNCPLYDDWVINFSKGTKSKNLTLDFDEITDSINFLDIGAAMKHLLRKIKAQWSFQNVEFHPTMRTKSRTQLAHILSHTEMFTREDLCKMILK